MDKLMKKKSLQIKIKYGDFKKTSPNTKNIRKALLLDIGTKVKILVYCFSYN